MRGGGSLGMVDCSRLAPRGWGSNGSRVSPTRRPQGREGISALTDALPSEARARQSATTSGFGLVSRRATAVSDLDCVRRSLRVAVRSLTKNTA